MRKLKKTFVLCLGTQKAGTSWLFDFIKDIDTVNMGFRKEYHVFDRLQFNEFMQEDIRALAQASVNTNISNNFDLWKRLSMIANQQEYYDYFESLLSIKGAALTGDFTPEYSLLNKEVLAEIKNSFRERGISVKVIFLMRDPVERIWSASRMTKRVLGREVGLLDEYKSKFVEMLTRYEIIVPKIRSVFPEEDIYFNFYENLFNEKIIDELLEFLSLPKRSPRFDKRVNESKYEIIDESERKVVGAYYAETYNYINREFGDIYSL